MTSRISGIIFAILQRVGGKPRIQPRTGVCPVAFRVARDTSNALAASSIVSPAKKSQRHQLRRPRVFFRQFLKRLIQRQQFLPPSFGVPISASSTATRFRFSPASSCSSDGRCRRADSASRWPPKQKSARASPKCAILIVDELNVGFMNQRGRLQSLPRRLIGQPLSGQFSQLRIHQRSRSSDARLSPFRWRSGFA